MRPHSCVSHRPIAFCILKSIAPPTHVLAHTFAHLSLIHPRSSGAKLKPLGYSVLAGMIIWCIPAPAGVTAQAWHLLAVFVGTIVGIITNVRHPPREPPSKTLLLN